MRKCFSHFGHTFKFSSRSFFQMICRQFSHFTHNPSVRTVFSPDELSSPDSRLNEAISQFLVPSNQYRVKPPFFSVLDTRYLVLYAPLRHYAFFVRVFHLPHLRYRVGGLDNCGMRVPSRQDDMHHLRFLLQALHYFHRIQHAVADGVIDLIQYHQIPLARLDRHLALSPRFFHHLYIFRVRLFCAHLHKSPAHLLHYKLVTKGLHRIQFTVVPGAFQELQHKYPHTLSYCSQGCPHCRSRLPFARYSVHDNETATYVSHKPKTVDSTRKRRIRWVCIANVGYPDGADKAS